MPSSISSTESSSAGTYSGHPRPIRAHKRSSVPTNAANDRPTDRQTDRLTNRQTDRQTYRPIDRQTYKQTDRQTEHLPYSLAVYAQSVTIGLTSSLSQSVCRRYSSISMSRSVSRTRSVAPHTYSVCHTASLSSYYTLSVCRSPGFPAALPAQARSAVID